MTKLSWLSSASDVFACLHKEYLAYQEFMTESEIYHGFFQPTREGSSFSSINALE
ncbi:hypothetical protein HMPREF0454_00728 [Hafnia alvei ATCC 51873]|uniref:Uncharacterized protein n=1 Tax=Hafnia alvei ATCC 51873 TaxID=1002364 RepID=G9Y2B6_HAFAL|nr:hypothetical protein HMPREF0454_00728 [Hafnia alvei ATCC 51873]